VGGPATFGAQINPDGGFLAVGNTSGVMPQMMGGGVLMMWHPGKGAFRAGQALASEWSDEFIGQASIAMNDGTIASGRASTAMGSKTTASGDLSTALGERTTASGFVSTAIGSYTTASGAFTTAMGALASTNDQHGAFVYGDASTLPGGSVVQATAPNQFVVRAAGGTIFYSSRDLASGVSLAPGAGAWASVSDVRRKENFREVDGESVLGRIARMPVREWNYRTQAASIRHLGPTAQDFRAAFGLGESDTTITTTDIDGINLLAVQALERRTREQAREIEALRAELAALRAAIAQRRE